MQFRIKSPSECLSVVRKNADLIRFKTHGDLSMTKDLDSKRFVAAELKRELPS